MGIPGIWFRTVLKAGCLMWTFFSLSEEHGLTMLEENEIYHLMVVCWFSLMLQRMKHFPMLHSILIWFYTMKSFLGFTDIVNVPIILIMIDDCDNVTLNHNIFVPIAVLSYIGYTEAVLGFVLFVVILLELTIRGHHEDLVVKLLWFFIEMGGYFVLPYVTDLKYHEPCYGTFSESKSIVINKL